MESNLLDVVIGVVFVWLLFSIMLSAVSEAFAYITHVRAKHLWVGIGRLLDPEKSKLPRKFLDAAVRLPVGGKFDLRPRNRSEPGKDPVWLVKQFAERPDRKADDEGKALRARMAELYERLAPQIVETAQPGRLSKVTHLASAAVADAMIALAAGVYKADLVRAADELEWSATKKAGLTATLTGVSDNQRITLKQLHELPNPGGSTKADREAVHGHAARALTPRDIANAFSDNPALANAVSRAVAGLPDADRLRAAKDAIAGAFDREMAQMSAFYRRQSRKLLGMLAVIAAVVLQANSIGLALDLWHDNNLRASLVGSAVTAAAAETLDQAVTSPTCEEEATTTSTSSSSSTSTSSTTTSSTTTSSTIAPSTTTTAVVDPVRQARTQLDCAGKILARAHDFHAGVGWTDFKKAHGSQDPARPQWADVFPYLTERWGFVGRPITAIALLFGAQFWFDVLRRLVGLRKPPPASAAPAA